jgi:hypothetical protein
MDNVLLAAQMRRILSYETVRFEPPACLSSDYVAGVGEKPTVKGTAMS